ncbi:MAG: SIR2 family protein [Nostoc sp. NMS7]|uniref:P-loop NTPase n=1 Tax=Nostoc sp. NMS7 TaxID=2815391 RepID=UPI0025D87D73|nr:SIR2 family protein [Nostoc sp. NMS7]MBN3947382.1 SIR2 family protein [Nostoc sp. NMS7]
MELPEIVVSLVRSGQVVLFLGAGVSLDYQMPNRKHILSKESLRNALSQKFLGGQYSQESLQWITELAISETDLGTVQDFIADQFREIKPADFHLILPTFRWKGIVTANFDRLVENTYEKSKNRVQDLVPIISNNDRIDKKIQSANSLVLLKIHGCITITQDPKLPLILTTDQYTTHREGRDRLFKTFYEWCYESTVIFIGHGSQDPELRSILLQVLKEVNNRPSYYLVQSEVTHIEKSFWESKRISILEGGLEDLLKSLDQAILKQMRPLAQAFQIEHPIQRKFIKNEPVIGSVKDLLIHDVEYVHDAIETKEGKAKDFYKGFDLEWYPTIKNLDVRRRLTDTVLGDVILKPNVDRPTVSELYLIKAEAGAGKTIFLRRVAWEAATQADVICLFMRTLSTINFEAIRELYRLTNERIFIFIDAAADNITLILKLLQESRRFDVPLTIVTAERLNEWNMSCDSLADYVTNAYQLLYLSKTEIVDLVHLLYKYDALGPHLQKKTVEERVKEFEEKAGRQLLVALHEATMGRPFEEIIIDEYKNIYPKQAQDVYLTVCLLNRLSTQVRAGLIARVHDIGFNDFQEKLFAPLEHIVQVKGNPHKSDFYYTSRHPQIAQIIFEEVLTQDADRYNEYIRVLRFINISYDTDKDSFRKLINARALEKIFVSSEDVKAIFNIAKEYIGDDAYLYQQMANYERINPNGNYQLAEEFLNVAQELDPRDSSIVHTKAELAATRARKAERPLERQKFRNQALSILEGLIDKPQSDRYARVTYLKLAIDDFKYILEQPDSIHRNIEEGIRTIEKILETTKQKYPEDSFVNNSEADFAGLVNDNTRALKALKVSFETNSRDPYITMRLSHFYKNNNQLDLAKACLYKALNSQILNKELNYEYAQILRLIEPSNIESIIYYFRKAFSKGDQNYYAQFWYARYLFESKDLEKQNESKRIFSDLRDKAPIQYELRIKALDYVKDNGINKVFVGRVNRLEAEHGFVIVDGRGDNIFFHRNNMESRTWISLKSGSRICFNIGFTFSGPIAVKIQSS